MLSEAVTDRGADPPPKKENESLPSSWRGLIGPAVDCPLNRRLPVAAKSVPLTPSLSLPRAADPSLSLPAADTMLRIGKILSTGLPLEPPAAAAAEDEVPSPWGPLLLPRSLGLGEVVCDLASRGLLTPTEAGSRSCMAVPDMDVATEPRSLSDRLTGPPADPVGDSGLDPPC